MHTRVGSPTSHRCPFSQAEPRFHSNILNLQSNSNEEVLAACFVVEACCWLCSGSLVIRLQITTVRTTSQIERSLFTANNRHLHLVDEYERCGTNLAQVTCDQDVNDTGHVEAMPGTKLDWPGRWCSIGVRGSPQDMTVLKAQLAEQRF